MNFNLYLFFSLLFDIYNLHLHKHNRLFLFSTVISVRLNNNFALRIKLCNITNNFFFVIFQIKYSWKTMYTVADAFFLSVNIEAIWTTVDRLTLAVWAIQMETYSLFKFFFHTLINQLWQNEEMKLIAIFTPSILLLLISFLTFHSISFTFLSHFFFR